MFLSDWTGDWDCGCMFCHDSSVLTRHGKPNASGPLCCGGLTSRQCSGWPSGTAVCAAGADVHTEGGYEVHEVVAHEDKKDT